ncbi:MAG: UDP-N-acetylmuramoyl-L-alanine--D-glutamate ligase [Candidatus Peribacteraceae bacterium]|jgi:UDP-N-acetylmuramoylalanine--D-glutamate ligase|nr:UDP-N-acetylmuramoyl-L-alanine--D-glutamate ligase [Candidatus Peribacteraceae bacterium]MDP7646039.1 UDP-N-acetylmuramoyl-L-alanine--D-glutamate ligase [Candidatus Peribacteraceae bacterium]
MHLKDLNGKRVIILGFGREGQAMLKTLKDNNVKADITIADQNSNLQPTTYNLQTGDNYLENLNEYDVIIKSPGIPPCDELDLVKDKLTNSTQIFLDTVMEAGSTVIGVTGSKGKSTTVSLIHEILKNAGKDSHLVGNIGEPSITHIGEAGSDAIFVLEMSSYQLMQCTTSPQIAVVTSFFPEHLDYHKTEDNYLDAKKNIARYQKEDNVIFYNSEYEKAEEIAFESKGNKIPVDKENAPVQWGQVRLIGEHNQSNIALAYAVANYLKLKKDDIIPAIKKFEGLPHRLQNLGEHNGIIWVDDSISTTPETAIAAIDALGDQVETIILGGQDRGNDFSELGKRISSSSVKNVILMGESGSRIKEAIDSAGTQVKFFEAKDVQEIVAISKKANCQSANLPICLLSPASPSYDMFSSFEERGNEFRSCVLN